MRLQKLGETGASRLEAHKSAFSANIIFHLLIWIVIVDPKAGDRIRICIGYAAYALDRTTLKYIHTHRAQHQI